MTERNVVSPNLENMFLAIMSAEAFQRQHTLDGGNPARRTPRIGDYRKPHYVFTRHALRHLAVLSGQRLHQFRERSANRSANNCDQSGSGARRQNQVPGLQKECQWLLDQWPEYQNWSQRFSQTHL